MTRISSKSGKTQDGQSALGNPSLSLASHSLPSTHHGGGDVTTRPRRRASQRLIQASQLPGCNKADTDDDDSSYLPSASKPSKGKRAALQVESDSDCDPVPPTRRGKGLKTSSVKTTVSSDSEAEITYDEPVPPKRLRNGLKKQSVNITVISDDESEVEDDEAVPPKRRQTGHRKPAVPSRRPSVKNDVTSDDEPLTLRPLKKSGKSLGKLPASLDPNLTFERTINEGEDETSPESSPETDDAPDAEEDWDTDGLEDYISKKEQAANDESAGNESADDEPSDDVPDGNATGFFGLFQGQQLPSPPSASAETAAKNTARFEKKLSAIIEALIGAAKSFDLKAFSNRLQDTGMASSFVLVLRRSDRDVLCKEMISMIPVETRSILGSPNLRDTDLLRCPAVRLDESRWGVYVDVPSHCSTTAVEGVYVGSSTNREGVAARVKQHMQISAKGLVRLTDLEKTQHYLVTARPDVRCNFRLIGAMMRQPQPTYHMPFLEGLLMVYLGTMSGAIGRYSSPSTVSLIADVRAAVANKTGMLLPDFHKLGLNSAWSISQGFRMTLEPKKAAMLRAHLEWTKSNGNVCAVCRRDHGDRPSYGYGEQNRCYLCHKYLTRYKKERPYKVNRRDHEAWVARGNPDVCGNPACPRPRDESFLLFCEKSRCGACYSYRRLYKTERPIEVIEAELKRALAAPKTRDDHEVWVLSNPDVCGNPVCPRPRDYAFIGYCEEARCAPCHSYRTKYDRERPAKLTTRERGPRGPTRKDHDIWIQSHPDVCGNPACAIPREKGFIGFCEKTRCVNCYNYRARFKKERHPGLAEALAAQGK